jgi:hypothetical protein
MSKEFTVTVHFPPNGRDLLLARSFEFRAAAFQYAAGAASGKVALVTIQNSKGGLEGFMIGRDSLSLESETGAEVFLPVVSLVEA